MGQLFTKWLIKTSLESSQCRDRHPHTILAVIVNKPKQSEEFLHQQLQNLCDNLYLIHPSFSVDEEEHAQTNQYHYASNYRPSDDPRESTLMSENERTAKPGAMSYDYRVASVEGEVEDLGRGREVRTRVATAARSNNIS